MVIKVALLKEKFGCEYCEVACELEFKFCVECGLRMAEAFKFYLMSHTGKTVGLFCECCISKEVIRTNPSLHSRYDRDIFCPDCGGVTRVLFGSLED